MYKDLIEEITPLVEHTKDIITYTLPFYSEFVDDVEHGRITDINQIERNLTAMLDFCFDDKILILYKNVLRKLYKKYPDIVEFYDETYRYMWE